MGRTSLMATLLCGLSVGCVVYHKTTRTTTTPTTIDHETATAPDTKQTTTTNTDLIIPPYHKKTKTVTTEPAGESSGESAPSFSGEIMDSSCAAMGSHDTMMKQEGAADAKDCIEKCVHNGAKYVLYDTSTKTVYQLADQDKAREFAGQHVTVTGSLDASSKTISVQSISAG